MGHFFSGATVAKIDDKGRFVLPQEIRYGFVEEGRCAFAVGIGLGGCLSIYKKSAVQRIVERFRKHQHKGRFQKFFTLFFSTLHETECDKIGRVLLPQTLRTLAGIQTEMIVAGVLDKVELWSKELYEREQQSFFRGEGDNPSMTSMIEEAFALLHEEEEKPLEVDPSMNPVYF